MAGLALSFLLRGAGYKTIILKAPWPGDLLRDVDLLLVSPDLDDERRKGSLAILRSKEQGPSIPILTCSAAIEENVFAEDAAGSSWPVEIGGLARAIETTLRGNAESGPAIVATPSEKRRYPRPASVLPLTPGIPAYGGLQIY